MGEIQVIAQNELTWALAEKLRQAWDAYVSIDEPLHSEVLTEDYRAVHPDGTVHIGKPTAAEIAAAPIENYKLTELQAWPVGDEAAIATYTAEVDAPSSGSPRGFQFVVGEVWMKSGKEWKCRYYHATMLKN